MLHAALGEDRHRRAVVICPLDSQHVVAGNFGDFGDLQFEIRCPEYGSWKVFSKRD
jgi:hypothetical protein